MKTFALITEGITDQVVLTAILSGHYNDDLDVRIAQPLRDATDISRQGSFAGWENVFAYCASDFFEQQFLVNDFVVIQIDTDVCDEKNFNIALTIGGRERPVAEIIEDVKVRIISCIKQDVFAAYQDRIIFAVAIHSLECWLLPLFARTDAEARGTHKCEVKLNAILNKLDVRYEKTYKIYQSLSRKYSKSKNVKVAITKNVSLEIFVGALP